LQTLISEEELEVAVDTLKTLTKYPSAIKAKGARELRAAVYDFRMACTTGMSAGGGGLFRGFVWDILFSVALSFGVFGARHYGVDVYQKVEMAFEVDGVFSRSRGRFDITLLIVSLTWNPSTLVHLSQTPVQASRQQN